MRGPVFTLGHGHKGEPQIMRYGINFGNYEDGAKLLDTFRATAADPKDWFRHDARLLADELEGVLRKMEKA